MNLVYFLCTQLYYIGSSLLEHRLYLICVCTLISLAIRQAFLPAWNHS
jgi:hypothetical protein